MSPEKGFLNKDCKNNIQNIDQFNINDKTFQPKFYWIKWLMKNYGGYS